MHSRAMSSLIVSHDSHLMMLEVAVENVNEFFYLYLKIRSSILEFTVFLIRENICVKI